MDHVGGVECANISQIYHLIISSNDAAKDLVKLVIKKSPPNEHKYVYLRCIYKSVGETKKYFAEYEKIIRILFDEHSEYTKEFVNGMNQFLRTLCMLVSFIN